MNHILFIRCDVTINTGYALKHVYLELSVCNWIAPWPGVELGTFRSWAEYANHYTTVLRSVTYLTDNKNISTFRVLRVDLPIPFLYFSMHCHIQMLTQVSNSPHFWTGSKFCLKFMTSSRVLPQILLSDVFMPSFLHLCWQSKNFTPQICKVALLASYHKVVLLTKY